MAAVAPGPASRDGDATFLAATLRADADEDATLEAAQAAFDGERDVTLGGGRSPATRSARR